MKKRRFVRDKTCDFFTKILTYTTYKNISLLTRKKNMISWTLEKKYIHELKKFPANPRKLTVDQLNHLKMSIDKFGLIDKPILNKDDTIIGGHQRIEICKKNGIKEIECWVPDKKLSNKDIQELNIRLNKNHGEFDYDTLANHFEIPDLIEWGFSTNELVGSMDIKEEEEEKEKKTKKKKSCTCPSCGYEF